MQRYQDVLRVDPDQPDALYLSGMVHLAAGPLGTTLFVHNLADQPCRLQLGSQRVAGQRPLNFFADSDYGPGVDLDAVEVAGYGYRWIRLRRTMGA